MDKYPPKRHLKRVFFVLPSRLVEGQSVRSLSGNSRAQPMVGGQQRDAGMKRRAEEQLNDRSSSWRTLTTL